MKPLGSQAIIEFIDCRRDLLNDKDALETMLAKGIVECGLTLIGVTGKQFDPLGVTVVAVIGESHVIIHTYPEARHASIDIFTCSNGSHAKQRLLEYLKAHLDPRMVKTLDLERGNPIGITQPDWITCFSAAGYETRYHIKDTIYSHRSAYQQIDIIDNESFGLMMFLDKDLQVAEKDCRIYNKSLVDPIIEAAVPLDRVLILGGGDGGVLREILRHSPGGVTLVDIDSDVVEAAQMHLRQVCGDAFDASNVDVVIEDANVYLEHASGFDAVIYDLTMHPEALTRVGRTSFLVSMFSRVQRCLKPHGMVTMQCGADLDKETHRLLKNLLPTYFQKIELTGVFIPSFCERWVFASARPRRRSPRAKKSPAGKRQRATV